MTVTRKDQQTVEVRQLWAQMSPVQRYVMTLFLRLLVEGDAA